MPFDYTNAGVNNYSSPAAKDMLAEDQDNFSYDFKEKAKEQAFMAAGVDKTSNSQPAEPMLDLSSLETNTTTQEPELDLSSLSELETGAITVTAPKTPKVLKPKTMMEQALQLTGDVLTGAATGLAQSFDVMTFGLPWKAFNSVFNNTPDEQLTEDQRAYKSVAQSVNNASQLQVPSLTHLLKKTFGSDQDRLDVMDYQKALTQGIIDELQTQGIQAEARTNDVEGDESQGWSIYVKDAQGNDIKLDDPSMLDSMATEGWTIGLGVGGGILGAKAASQFTKNPFLIGAAALTGAVSGTTTGTLLDMLKANIKLNNDINGEQMKAKLAENASLEIVSAALAKPISMLGKGAIEGANIIKNYIFKGNIGGAVKEALIHTGLTREEGLKLVEEYSKFYNIDLDAPWLNSNKQLQEDLMLLRTLGSTSSKMGGPVADIRASDRAIRNATIDLTNRANIVIDKVASADPGVAVEVIQKDLPDYIKNVKAFYGDVKNSFAEFTKDYRFDLGNVIKGVKEQIPAQFKDPAIENKLVRFLSDIENNTIPRDGEALIRFKQELGDFIHENKSKMSYDVSKNLGNLAKTVDNEILRVGNQLVPENTIWKSGWKTANEEYSKMKSLEINSLYKALTRPGQSQDDLIRIFANYADTYDNTFFDVVSKLPKETRSKIDNAMMKHFVDKNTLGIGTDMQAIDFIKLDSQLKNVKFSDPEMIAHKDVIRQMSKLFKNDKALFQYAGGLARPSSGNTIATTAEGKVKAGIIQTLWDMFKSRIPTESGRVRALFSALKKSFENPLDVKAYDEIVNQLPIDQRDIRNPLSFASQMQQMRAIYAGTKNYQQGMGNVTPSIEATSSAPLEAEVIDFGSDAYKNIKSQENPIMVYSGEANDIIEAEIYPNQRLVITKDGHILPMEQLLQGERLPDNMRLPAKVETPVKSFFDMRMKLKTEPDLIKARNEVANAVNPEVKARLKQRLVNLLNYHKLRDEGLKPAEAHRAVYGDKNGVKTQMSAEVTAGLIGGGLNGVTIDNDGEIEVDVNKFMVGFGAGVVGVAVVKNLGKYVQDKEQVARDLSVAYKRLTSGDKMAFVRHAIEPQYIVANAYTPDLSDAKRFEIAMEKTPKAINNGVYEHEEMWKKGKFFIDFDGETRRWIDIDHADVKFKTKLAKNIHKDIKKAYPELGTKIIDIDPKSGISYQTSGYYSPLFDTIALKDKGARTLLHETQHAIQQNDNMPYRGSNQDKFDVREYAKKYNMSASDVYAGDVGEVYARFSEDGLLHIHPIIRAIAEQRLQLYKETSRGGKIVNIFGNVDDKTKTIQADILNKIRQGENIKLSDLPEIRKIVALADEDPDIAFNVNKLKEAGIKIAEADTQIAFPISPKKYLDEGIKVSGEQFKTVKVGSDNYNFESLDGNLTLTYHSWWAVTEKDYADFVKTLKNYNIIKANTSRPIQVRASNNRYDIADGSDHIIIEKVKGNFIARDTGTRAVPKEKLKFYSNIAMEFNL